MTAGMPGMLGMLMGGGALPPLGDLIKLPCAICLALGMTPASDAVTLAGGTLVCHLHVMDALPVDVCRDLDAGHQLGAGEIVRMNEVGNGDA